MVSTQRRNSFIIFFGKRQERLKRQKMETEQLCEGQTERTRAFDYRSIQKLRESSRLVNSLNLEVNRGLVNLYCSIQRAREISRDLPERLKNLGMEKGIQIIGIPNIWALREMISNINRNLKTDQRYEQKINEQNLTYTITRRE